MQQLKYLKHKTPKKLRSYIYNTYDSQPDTEITRVIDLKGSTFKSSWSNRTSLLLCLADEPEKSFIMYRCAGYERGNYAMVTVKERNLVHTNVANLGEIKTLCKGMELYKINLGRRKIRMVVKKKEYDIFNAGNPKAYIMSSALLENYWNKIYRKRATEYIVQAINQIYSMLPELDNTRNDKGEILNPYNMYHGQRHIAISHIDSLEKFRKDPYIFAPISPNDEYYKNTKMQYRHAFGLYPIKRTKLFLDNVKRMKHVTTLKILQEGNNEDFVL